MKLGYARVSTDDQDLARQISDLERVGCDVIYKEHASGGKQKVKERPELYAMLESIKPGDTIYVQKVDRLSRSISHFMRVMDEIAARNAYFKLTDNSIDTTTPNGRLLLHMLAAFAEFERELIKERTVDGLKQAVKNGSKLGRREFFGSIQLFQLNSHIDDTENISELAEKMGTSRPTLYRGLEILRKNYGLNPDADIPAIREAKKKVKKNFRLVNL